MRGSVQKKGNIYYAVVAIGSKRRWFKAGTTRKSGEIKLTEKLGEIDNETYAEIPKIDFGEFCDLWFKLHAETNLKPSTQKHYRDILTPLKLVFEGKKLTDVRTKHLQLYIVERLKRVSAHTIQSEIMVINLMFNHARKWGYVKNNPAQDIDRPRYTKPEVDIMEPGEIKRFLEQADKDRDHYRVAFRTSVETGLRAGELWGLQWGDIDWTEGRIHVRRSMWRSNLQIPKTKNAIRKVDISPALVTELKKWKLACPNSEDDLVFPSQTGGRTNHENAMNRHFRPILRRAGLRQVSFHSLRHTNASLRIAAGQHLKYMSKQLGHSSIKITLDVYGHLFKDSDFAKQQVGLLEQTLESVRNPLESPQKSISNSPEQTSNQLNTLEIHQGGHFAQMDLNCMVLR